VGRTLIWLKVVNARRGGTLVLFSLKRQMNSPAPAGAGRFWQYVGSLLIYAAVGYRPALRHGAALSTYGIFSLGPYSLRHNVLKVKGLPPWLWALSVSASDLTAC